MNPFFHAFLNPVDATCARSCLLRLALQDSFEDEEKLDAESDFEVWLCVIRVSHQQFLNSVQTMELVDLDWTWQSSSELTATFCIITLSRLIDVSPHKSGEWHCVNMIYLIPLYWMS